MTESQLLDAFPERWESRRVDWAMSEVRRTVDPSERFAGDVFLYSIPVVQETGDGQVEDSKEIRSAKLRISAPTLLVSKLNPRKAVVVAAHERELPTVCSSEFICLEPQGCDLHYARYLFLSEQVRQHLESLVKSATRSHQRVQPSDVTKLWLSWPSRDEQSAIASFLNRETNKIDTLIAKKERLLELLEEKRTALITQTVTKGLDHNAPMEDSCVGWLGDIPTHWEVANVKYVARMESGHTPDRKVPEYWDGGIQWLSLADSGLLKTTDLVEETTYQISLEGLANSSARLLPPGTVAFSRDATVGLCALLAKEMAVSQHFIGWVCSGRVMPEYLLLVLKSMDQELERLTMGATIRTLGFPEVSSLSMPVPPLDEQAAIVNHVTHEEAKIGALKDGVANAISLLHEYRTALISAAVTGKIKVREEVPA